MKQRLIMLAIWSLCQIGMIVISLRMLYASWTAPAKVWAIAVAIDDTANVAGNGRLGQTISARAAHARVNKQRWGCVLCRWLDLVDPGHCDRALVDPGQNLKE